ncbi:hypothetical protein HELRODRAFT_165936 [Helobdella robusta]|uniref:Uncharacterized protein n=1 Tax=Helobdella robusta TaxID=6412 RepID=T1EXH2_HELRO|nr:hypothetical protein HELRODRAFT_165936 [Helobdella robusta]ESN90290.1 hypothetical protein HELRODRAFT_165936 [Helobdella robusta]
MVLESSHVDATFFSRMTSTGNKIFVVGGKITTNGLDESFDENLDEYAIISALRSALKPQANNRNAVSNRCYRIKNSQNTDKKFSKLVDFVFVFCRGCGHKPTKQLSV